MISTVLSFWTTLIFGVTASCGQVTDGIVTDGSDLPKLSKARSIS